MREERQTLPLTAVGGRKRRFLAATGQGFYNQRPKKAERYLSHLADTTHSQNRDAD